MTVESPSAEPHGEELPELDVDRNEGIRTVPKRLPKPPAHGFAGSVVLNDLDREAREIGVDVGRRNLPDGSLYQHARAYWYEYGDDVDGQSVVLTDSYDPDWSDREDQLAIVLTSSGWRAGTESSSGRYSQWYKYDLKLRQVQDGEVLMDRAPAESVNVKIQPQYQQLVTSEGDPLDLPYGEGSLVAIQATWIEETDQALERALDVVRAAFGYETRPGDLNPESKRLWKAEAHHRFNEELEDDVVHTIRQSTDLLARNAADVDERSKYDDQVWLEAKITTRDWRQLGFPDLDAPVLLKVYRTEDPEQSRYPYDQPKIEAALAGNPGRSKLSWDQYDDVLATLREIVLTHLSWAGVGPDQLVADEISEGPHADPYAFHYPLGRRDWLKDHYYSLVPEIYREATKANSVLPHDILEVVRRRGTVTYEDLMRETGGSYRAVRRHVRRLEELGGEDEPGILERVNDAVTFVAFSSRVLEEEADDVLDEIRPDETVEDLHERARDRRERRRELEEARDQDDNQQDDQDDSDDGSAGGTAGGGSGGAADGSDDEIWRLLPETDLSVDNLTVALEKGYLERDHVKLRTDPYSFFAD